MTTIAYRDGIIAADSRISYSTIHNGNRSKIARCGSYIVAIAGASWLRPAIEQWAAEGAWPDTVPEVLLDNDDQFDALFIDRDGVAHLFENGHLIPVHSEYTAIGSGMMLALGAMAHGASAAQAVIAAGLHDKNTGGPIDTLEIRSQEF